ncbi:glycine betaine/proline transport system substrate-binding protein [Mycetocola sp. 2940]
MDFRIPLGQWVEAFVDVLTETLQPVFDVLRAVFLGLYDLVNWIFQSPPFWIIILVIAVLGFFAKGWKLAVGVIVGFGLILAVDQWENAMDSLSLVLVASVLAVLISVPLGILAARSDTASRVLRPILDFLQTMPAFVYLIPALILFRVGVVPGIVATIIFALAPGVRLTELGIRGVDKEVVEAGHAFGSSPFRILRQIQLPLAMPSIMAGVNQVIMLSLSMVVIAGMVGAGGLGGDVVASLNRIDIGLGFEAGLSVVILAIVLDRLTASLGTRKARVKKAAAVPVASDAQDGQLAASNGSLLKAKKKRRIVVIGIAAAVTAGLVGFAGFANIKPGAAAGENKDLTLAVFNGWDEGVATSWLWKTILEDEGYTVELEYADPAPVFEGISSGDYDFTTDIWLPLTHKEYIDSYGDEIVDLGAWNDESKLTLAVNEDAPIDTIEELAANADLFGNRIVGIEPGAGLTATMEEAVIPTYGLDDMEFLTSSTAAMLSELKSATDKGENVVVTLWEPHRAYAQFPIKNLEDTEGAFGATESLHSYGSTEFTESSPEAAKMLENFTMDSETLMSLVEAMFVEYEGDDYAPVVEKWISENQEYVDGLTS